MASQGTHRVRSDFRHKWDAVTQTVLTLDNDDDVIGCLEETDSRVTLEDIDSSASLTDRELDLTTPREVKRSRGLALGDDDEPLVITLPWQGRA